MARRFLSGPHVPVPRDALADLVRAVGGDESEAVPTRRQACTR